MPGFIYDRVNKSKFVDDSPGGGGSLTLCLPLICTLAAAGADSSGGGGGLLEFWYGVAHVLAWGLKFRVGEIIWGLKIYSLKCAYVGSEIYGRRDYLGFNIYMSPKTYFQPENLSVRRRTADYLGSLKKLVGLFEV